jgi:hypothetical protein
VTRIRWHLCLLTASAVTGALIVFTGLAAAVPQGLYGGRPQTLRNRHAAYQDAPRLLAQLRLPAGATLSRVVARSRLHELEAAENHADAADVWSVSGTIATTLAYVRAHPPAGSTMFADGDSSRPGQPDYARWVEFAEPSVGAVLADRHLYVSVSSTGRDHTSVFAQAESIWVSARPSRERIPAATRRVVVRITQAHRSPRTVIVSRRRLVDEVVAAFNTVEIVQPDVYNCGVMLSPRAFSYEFLAAQGRSLARVTYTVNPGGSPGPCNPMTVRIGGRRRDDLLGGPQIAEVQRLVGTLG